MKARLGPGDLEADTDREFEDSDIVVSVELLRPCPADPKLVLFSFFLVVKTDVCASPPASALPAPLLEFLDILGREAEAVEDDRWFIVRGLSCFTILERAGIPRLRPLRCRLVWEWLLGNCVRTTFFTGLDCWGCIGDVGGASASSETFVVSVIVVSAIVDVDVVAVARLSNVAPVIESASWPTGSWGIDDAEVVAANDANGC